MSKVTDWYPASVKPVRVRLYDCRYYGDAPHVRSRYFWDGIHWRRGGPAGTLMSFGMFGDQWRGLKEPALPDNREVSDGS